MPAWDDLAAMLHLGWIKRWFFMAKSGGPETAFQQDDRLRRPNRGNMNMMKLLKNIKINESGASAAEYALMVAVMGAAVVVAIGALSGSISGALTNAGTQITTTQGK